MNRTRLSACILALALGFASLSAQAVPISYNESDSGDLVVGITTFALDFGANTVTGTVGGTDFDLFNVTLPTSGVLTSISANLQNGTGGNGTFPLTLQAIAPPVVYSTPITSFGITNLIFSDAATSYISIGFNGIPGLGVIDYVITLNVASVPEPSTLGLLGVGLLGLFMRRKRVA